MTRSNYWSCSKFANWLRGSHKPYALDGKGWKEWEVESKNNHPWRYWLAEEGLDLAQNVVWGIPDRIYQFKCYFKNRYITKSHSLTADKKDIKPGEWCDVGHRFLPCLFNELKDFVEIELAWQHILWNEEASKKFKAPWYAKGWFRSGMWRSQEAGLSYLVWATQLRWDKDEIGEESERVGELTPQAISSQEILDLYTWWTKVRPARKDPYQESGWSAHSDAMDLKYGSLLESLNSQTEEEDQESDRTRKILENMEAVYEQEDEEMMIRLIRIRNNLWT